MKMPIEDESMSSTNQNFKSYFSLKFNLIFYFLNKKTKLIEKSCNGKESRKKSKTFKISINFQERLAQYPKT